ncbi:hypothetical protein [Micromonospora zamorensis]|uniref:hypothetical protein n=1 Tax=Micromonospora zamorensis TaxID=709883 RepID=UPI003793FE95
MQFFSAHHPAIEVDEDGFSVAAEPDFAKLFPPCVFSGDDCDACPSFQLTPRAAVAPWTIAYADQAFDDIRVRGLSR